MEGAGVWRRVVGLQRNSVREISLLRDPLLLLCMGSVGTKGLFSLHSQGCSVGLEYVALGRISVLQAELKDCRFPKRYKCILPSFYHD